MTNTVNRFSETKTHISLNQEIKPMNITFFVGKPPKGLSIICGVSLGEGQRPTAVAILAVTGDPQEPTFELAALKRYRTTTTINDIARDLAASLCLDRLRAGLPVFQA